MDETKAQAIQDEDIIVDTQVPGWRSQKPAEAEEKPPWVLDADRLGLPPAPKGVKSRGRVVALAREACKVLHARVAGRGAGEEGGGRASGAGQGARGS